MIHCDRRYRIGGVLSAWNIKNPIIPMPRLGLPISESVHSKPLPFALMPSSFIPMPTCETIHSKTMHLVCKVFSSINVPIPIYETQISQWSQVINYFRIRVMSSFYTYTANHILWSFMIDWSTPFKGNFWCELGSRRALYSWTGPGWNIASIMILLI